MRPRQLVGRAISIALVVIGGVRCADAGVGGGGGGTGGGATLAVVSGKDKQAALTSGLVQIQVELTGATDINNQTIDWTVTGGGGSVPGTSQTSNTGIATVNWNLGSSIGVQSLKAEYTEPGSSTVSVNVVAVAVVNPACVPGRYLNGVLSAGESWTSTGGAIVLPNGANTPPHGLISMAPGTTVCLGPLQNIEFDLGGRLSAAGSGASPVTVTAMDLAQPWGSLRFSGAPAQPSTISHAVLDHGSLGAIALSDNHVLQIDNSTITEMTGLGVRIVAPGSFVHTTNISNVSGQPGAFGARLGSASAPSAVLDFSARVTNTAGIMIDGAGAALTACEVTGTTGVAIEIANGAGPVSVNGCNIVGNTLGIRNYIGNASVDATGNWWGGAAGPALGTNIGTVDQSGWLGGPVPLGY